MTQRGIGWAQARQLDTLSLGHIVPPLKSIIFLREMCSSPVRVRGLLHLSENQPRPLYVPSKGGQVSRKRGVLGLQRTEGRGEGRRHKAENRRCHELRR